MNKTEHSHRRRGALGWIVLAALLLSCSDATPETAYAAEDSNETEGQTTTVTVLELEPQKRFTTGFTVNCTLKAYRDVVVYPKVTARLVAYPAEEGDEVEEGEPLAELDHRDIDAQVGSTKAQIAVALAELESAKASLDNAEVEYNRYKTLVDKGYATTQQLDAKETAYTQAKAQVRLARASVQRQRSVLKEQRVLLTEYTLNSPIDGTLLDDYDHTPGEMISPSTPVAHVGVIQRLKAVLNPEAAKARNVRKGMKASVTTDSVPGRTYRAEVIQVASQVDADTRTIEVKLLVDNRDGELKPGMFGRAKLIVTEARNALVVPQDACLESNGQCHVFVARDGVARRVEVVTGPSDGRHVVVEQGLSAGDLVILSDMETLQEGDRVSISERRS
ncbi:MAG: efflux RND transporter periplasmic adaptor subunit [Synergistales bacterium]|nr:efflux RND transporter periplasmic adaptor subunit [Synergistales bacterium]